MNLKAKIIAAIEQHCSEGASGRLIGADDAADEILEMVDGDENADPFDGMSRDEAQAATNALRRDMLDHLAAKKP